MAPVSMSANCLISDYVDAREVSWIEVKRRRQIRQSKPQKSLPPVIWAVPFWQFLNHQWTILPLSADWRESIAFALALLLNTDAITFYDCNNASVKEFKLFRKDKLVEP